MKKLLISILLIACSDVIYEEDLTSQQSNEAIEKSLLGNTCASGCIWSSYAVSYQAQVATHTCDGKPCACVVKGDIWTLCNPGNEVPIHQDPLWDSNVSNSQQQTSQYNLYFGNQLADAGRRQASYRNSYGYCYAAVADAIESLTGPFLWGSHAYQAADQLSTSRFFYEKFEYDLRNLPAGVIVVWGKGNSRSGHISIALGNGQEASDHISQQMTYHYGGASPRVFYPK